MGWEYMWVRYTDSEDAAKAIVKKPVAVYVEQVYEYGDSCLLGGWDVAQELTSAQSLSRYSVKSGRKS